jgi:hypothetical protein
LHFDRSLEFISQFAQVTDLKVKVRRFSFVQAVPSQITGWSQIFAICFSYLLGSDVGKRETTVSYGMPF